MRLMQSTVLALLLFSFLPAIAFALPCGTVITQDTQLTSNVGPCNGYGLIVGAPNVHIDIDDHWILGQGNLGGHNRSPYAGILVPAGMHNVRITGVQADNYARIRGFRHGIRIDRAENTRIRGILMLNNNIAISGSSAHGLRLSSLRFEPQNSYGMNDQNTPANTACVRLTHSNRVLIGDSESVFPTASRFRRCLEFGVELVGGTGSEINYARFRSIDTPMQYGVRLRGTTLAYIGDSTFSDLSTGVYVTGHQGQQGLLNMVQSNWFTGNTWGVRVVGQSNAPANGTYVWDNLMGSAINLYITGGGNANGTNVRRNDFFLVTTWFNWFWVDGGTNSSFALNRCNGAAC